MGGACPTLPQGAFSLGAQPGLAQEHAAPREMSCAMAKASGRQGSEGSEREVGAEVERPKAGKQEELVAGKGTECRGCRYEGMR